MDDCLASRISTSAEELRFRPWIADLRFRMLIWVPKLTLGIWCASVAASRHADQCKNRPGISSVSNSASGLEGSGLWHSGFPRNQNSPKALYGMVFGPKSLNM